MYYKANDNWIDSWYIDRRSGKTQIFLLIVQLMREQLRKHKRKEEFTPMMPVFTMKTGRIITNQQSMRSNRGWIRFCARNEGLIGLTGLLQI